MQYIDKDSLMRAIDYGNRAIGGWMGYIVKTIYEQISVFIGLEPVLMSWHEFVKDPDGTWKNCPEDGQQVLICDKDTGNNIRIDTFFRRSDGSAYLTGEYSFGGDDVLGSLAWMELPNGYRMDDDI